MVRWDMGLNRKRLAYFEFNTDDSGQFFPPDLATISGGRPARNADRGAVLRLWPGV